MKHYIIFFLMLPLSPAIAQLECELSPALEAGFPSELPTPQNFCFDISEIINECIPVYVRTNIHFFLDDDCDGNLATANYVTENLSSYNAFILAEDLIDNANLFFENMSANTQNLNYQWNSAEHNAPVTSNQCTPIRYILSGVYIHCSSSDQDVTLTEGFSNFNNFEIDPLSEVNVFVSNFITGGGNGFADPSTNQVCVENFSAGLFNHELGHVFSLNHTFVNDLCDDTWRYDWGWNLDCVGPDEVIGNRCWSSSPRYGVPPNDLDACDNNLFCEDHPCCAWTAQNNNLMTYSQWGYDDDYSALTPCQINLMITDISDNMCDYVADIHNGCPPPSANIGVIPTFSGVMECPACFYLNASYNESVYSVTIYNSNNVVILETGEIESEAGKYCLTPRINKYGQYYWPNGMIAGQTYAIRLQVWNSCGDFHESYLNFVLPNPCSATAQNQEDVLEIISVNPNPATNNVEVEFNLTENENVIIYGLQLASTNYYGIVYQEYHQAQDNQVIELNISQWATGYNCLIVLAGNEIEIENIVKD